MMVSASEVVRAVGGVLLQGCGEQQLSSVSTDSRELKPGALFFALKGEKSDAHDFVPEAERLGAAGAVVARPLGGIGQGFALIQVDDPLMALGNLGGWWRRKFQIPCVAITGSSGKTTTKEMTAKILSDRFPTLANEENLNTEVGVPLTLFRLEGSHRALVVELGMRGRGQIRFLADMVGPQVGVITNVGSAHVGLLGSREAICEAKLELARAIVPEGTLVVFGDDPLLRRRALEHFKGVATFGLGGDNDLRATDVVAEGPDARFKMHFGEREAEVWLPIPGVHNVLNALAATSAAMRLGISLAEAAASLRDFRPVRMRCQPLQTGAGITILNDAYNANPESARAALRVLSVWPGEEEKVAIFGEMLELGEFGWEAHLEIGREAARVGVGLVVAVGELGRAVVKGAKETEGFAGEAEWFRTKEEAKKFVLKRVRPGAVVLVKGSRMSGMEEMVDALQGEPFRANPQGEEGSCLLSSEGAS